MARSERGWGLALLLGVATTGWTQPTAGLAPATRGGAGNEAAGAGAGPGRPVQLAQASGPNEVNKFLGTVQAYHMQAGVERRNGRLPAAAALLQKILRLECPTDPKAYKFMGSVALNLADLQAQQGQWGEAEKSIREGLGWLEKPGLPPSLHLAELLKLHSQVLGQLGRREESERALRRSVETYEKLDSQ